LPIAKNEKAKATSLQVEIKLR